MQTVFNIGSLLNPSRFLRLWTGLLCLGLMGMPTHVCAEGTRCEMSCCTDSASGLEERSCCEDNVPPAGFEASSCCMETPATPAESGPTPSSGVRTPFFSCPVPVSSYLSACLQDTPCLRCSHHQALHTPGPPRCVDFGLLKC